MKILTYNVNGIRSAQSKGIEDWLNESQADLICLQELKADEEQVDLTNFKKMGYHLYWHSAVKKGYSGVAIFSKHRPQHIEIGCGMPKYDTEGRVIRADFEDLSVISVYMPSGSSGDERQAFKMEWLADFQEYINNLKQEKPNLIISGDYNICHRPIDIHDPIRNKNSSGFLPEEREWMEQFVKSGFVDSFRHFNEEPHHYTWWSYRAGARKNNKGWRIDYQMVTDQLQSRMQAAEIWADVVHSDHCPSLLVIDSHVK
jgi:exodeoxyribonuclease III